MVPEHMDVWSTTMEVLSNCIVMGVMGSAAFNYILVAKYFRYTFD
jgi:hypothetical protein